MYKRQGYVSLGSLDDSVKALKIDGAEATAENIKAGKYKVSRPFNIAVKKDMKNEVAKDFINYVMSEEGQKIVSDNGYIPVDGAKPYSGKEVSGKVVVGGSSSVSPVMEKLIEGYKMCIRDSCKTFSFTFFLRRKILATAPNTIRIIPTVRRTRPIP